MLFQESKATNTDTDSAEAFKPSENFLDTLAEKVISKFKLQLEERKTRDRSNLSLKTLQQERCTQTEVDKDYSLTSVMRTVTTLESTTTLGPMATETSTQATTTSAQASSSTTTASIKIPVPATFASSPNAAITSQATTFAPITNTANATAVVTSTVLSATRATTTATLTTASPTTATAVTAAASSASTPATATSGALVEDPIVTELTSEETLTKDDAAQPKALTVVNPDVIATSTGSDPPHPDITEASTQTSLSPKPTFEDIEAAAKELASVTTQTENLQPGKTPQIFLLVIFASTLLLTLELN